MTDHRVHVRGLGRRVELARIVTAPPAMEHHEAAIYRIGMPMKSMYGEAEANVITRQVWSRCLWGGLTAGALQYQHVVPLMPLWPGFLGNTVIYAIIVAALRLAGGNLRKRSRHRRGLCRSCGYDLRGHRESGVEPPRCPECGAVTSVVQSSQMKSISHDRGEETPEAKARWFQGLSMEQRLAHFAEYYDLALQLNPDILKRKDVPPPSERVQIVELP